ncbi:MAG: hypothetical protein ACREQ5_11445 [Candidatus Dormibacteria bacterium]
MTMLCPHCMFSGTDEEIARHIPRHLVEHAIADRRRISRRQPIERRKGFDMPIPPAPEDPHG